MKILSTLFLLLTASVTSPAQVAELPRVSVNTTMPVRDGRVLFVAADGDLQAALNQAQPGDVVELEAEASFTGKYEFKNIADNGKWIIVRSSRWAELPEGVRVSPADATKMAKIIAPDTSFALDLYPTYAPTGVTKARRIRFVGIEVSANPSYMVNFGLIKCGTNGSWQTSAFQAPEDIIFDRCYVHGLPDRDAFRGIQICSTRTAIIDSHFSDFHVRGFDSQAILVANSPGGLLFRNNNVQGAAENLMVGGLDLRIQGLVPSDITVRGNTFTKPLSWQGVWSVKNLFELKNAERVLIEENVFENNWVDGQAGLAILFTPRNQDGANPWAAVRDVTFQNNTVRNVAGGIHILGTDYNHPSQRAERIVIRGNRFEGLGATVLGVNGRFLVVVDGARDIIVQNNSFISDGAITPVVFDGAPVAGFVFTDNILSRGSFGVFGSGKGEGRAALDYYAPGHNFKRNVLIGGQAQADLYPEGNFFTQ